MAPSANEAAIVTVGSELTLGLRLDTNTRAIAAALSRTGHTVVEAVTVADELEALAKTLSRLCSQYAIVVVTGGLGPTHDDITREAAAQALALERVPDDAMVDWLEGISGRHQDAEAAQQMMRQAEILEGAEIIRPTSGTAPGQIVPTPAGKLVLLPGPPHEMGPMLTVALGTEGEPVSLTLRCVAISESDAQVRAARILESFPAVQLTVLATPLLVDIVLVDSASGRSALGPAHDAVRAELARYIYTADDRSLAQVVIDSARGHGLRLGTAESCTGGLLSAALTAIPGASAVVGGGVVAYSNDIKTDVLGVSPTTLDQHGAVSEASAVAMAEGAARVLSADLTVSITGVAGPDGGSADKPVGLVWFGICHQGETSAFSRKLRGDREGVRKRAVVTALDAFWRELDS